MVSPGSVGETEGSPPPLYDVKHQNDLIKEWRSLYEVTGGRPWVQDLSHPASFSVLPCGYTVCRVRWAHSTIADPAEFYDLLMKGLPEGTLVFGNKQFSLEESHLYGATHFYGAVLAFPCRLRSWVGYNQGLYVVRPDGLIDTVKVTLQVVTGTGIDASSRFLAESRNQLWGSHSHENLFGEVFWEPTMTEDPGVSFETVGSMWKGLTSERYAMLESKVRQLDLEI